MNDEHFRAGVGMLVLNADGFVLVGQRVSISDAWQAPQGGLSPNEDPLEAAYRELREETSIERSTVELIAEYPTWLTYELPPESRSVKTGRGQAQKWFLFQLLGREQDLGVIGTASAEFNRLGWWPMRTLIERAWHVRRPIYEVIALHWAEFLGPSDTDVPE